MAQLGRVRSVLAKEYFGYLRCIANQTASITSWDVNSVKGTKYYKDGKIKLKDTGIFLKQEVEIYKNKFQNILNSDIRFDIKSGDFENIWKFNDRQTIDKWIVTSDKDNIEGRSDARFQLSDKKTGVFHGYLNTDTVKDGLNKYAGYCNMRSPRNYEAGYAVYDFDPFNTLLLKVRGDGRSYLLTISEQKYFDIQNYDLFCYPLYTRGGPYWQTVMIPFSKFFLTSHGRIQDKQEPLNGSKVGYIGITCQDGFDGPFNLEIDSIALLYDSSNTSEFFYESYMTDANAVGC